MSPIVNSRSIWLVAKGVDFIVSFLLKKLFFCFIVTIFIQLFPLLKVVEDILSFFLGIVVVDLLHLWVFLKYLRLFLFLLNFEIDLLLLFFLRDGFATILQIEISLSITISFLLHFTGEIVLFVYSISRSFKNSSLL